MDGGMLRASAAACDVGPLAPAHTCRASGATSGAPGGPAVRSHLFGWRLVVFSFLNPWTGLELWHSSQLTGWGLSVPARVQLLPSNKVPRFRSCGLKVIELLPFSIYSGSHLPFVPGLGQWPTFEVDRKKRESDILLDYREWKLKNTFSRFLFIYTLNLLEVFTSWIAFWRLRRQKWEGGHPPSCVGTGRFSAGLHWVYVHQEEEKSSRPDLFLKSRVVTSDRDGMPTFHLLILVPSLVSKFRKKKQDLVIHPCSNWMNLKNIRVPERRHTYKAT